MKIETPQADANDLPPIGTSRPPWTSYGFSPWVQPAANWVWRFLRPVWRPESILALMVVFYFCVFGWLTWLQQANFGTFDYDMGYFDQSIWLSAHHPLGFVTIRGSNMWANHVNPIIYALVPFYWLGAGPHFLYVVQTLSFAGAAIPLWLLAKDRLGKPWLALGIPFAWLLYPAVEWMNWWHFHPESIGVLAFLFAYWFADRGYWRWYWVCVVLVLACKEDATFPIMALGILLFFRQHRKAGLITFAGALSWFVICILAIMPAAAGGAAPFYLYRFSTLGNSVGQIILNIIRHPTRVINLAFSPDRYSYYAKLFLPVLGLAFLAPATLFVAFPTLLENVTNNQGYAHDIKFQYTSFVAAGIFLAVVEGLRNLKTEMLRPVILTLCVVALVANRAWSPSPLDHQQFRSGVWALAPTPTTDALAQMIKRVPASAGVSASYTVVPHLSHRDQIYTFPNPWIRSYYGITNKTPESPTSIQYLVIDEAENSATTEVLLRELTGPRGKFRILEQRDMAVLAVRRGHR